MRVRRSSAAVVIALLMAGVGIEAAGAASRTTRPRRQGRPRSTTTAVATTARLPTTSMNAPLTGSGPTIAGCPLFPADNWWNQDISSLPVHPQSATWVASVSATRAALHPDTGSNPEYGIPFVVVGAAQPPVAIRYTAYGDESDPGPFPIPLNAPIEAGGDRHVIAVQQGSCRLFELFAAKPTATGWEAESGATWDLRSNALRPAAWTSADAAGLPILPGLMRFDEIRWGEIRHALRFTASRTQRGFITPARHSAGRDDPSLPPMGARFRLRADADLSGFRGDALVVLRALQRYGMILADNGSSWFISGASDPRWDDDDLAQLKRVPGSWFEVVDTGPIQRG